MTTQTYTVSPQAPAQGAPQPAASILGPQAAPQLPVPRQPQLVAQVRPAGTLLTQGQGAAVSAPTPPSNSTPLDQVTGWVQNHRRELIGGGVALLAASLIRGGVLPGQR